MKTLIVVALLALTTTASAAVVKEKDLALTRSLASLHAMCAHNDQVFEGDQNVLKAICAARDVLLKEAETRGYCFYGRGIVGRWGPGRKHCYEVTN